MELARRALIERNAADESVTLHGLLREYTRERLGEDQLTATHNALLSAYNPDGKPWSKIEHDGYLYYHLAYHLREAGHKEELYTLLTESSDWVEAKFIACTGDMAYVADLDLAIGDFADPLTAPEILMSVKLHTARQVVHARVSDYTNTDLQTLVWLGCEDEALAHTRLRHEAEGKFYGLLSIYDILKQKGVSNPSLLSETREVARSIEDDRRRRWQALGDLAAALARAGDDNRARELFDEAEEIARSFEDEFWRSTTLEDLTVALAQAGRYEKAREVARSIEDYGRRWRVLSSMAAAIAQVGRFNYALTLLGLRKLDEFLEILAKWALSFEQVAPGLSVDVLREATGIAGWVRSDWREIHELLNF